MMRYYNVSMRVIVKLLLVARELSPEPLKVVELLKLQPGRLDLSRAKSPPSEEAQDLIRPEKL